MSAVCMRTYKGAIIDEIHFQVQKANGEHWKLSINLAWPKELDSESRELSNWLNWHLMKMCFI